MSEVASSGQKCAEETPLEAVHRDGSPLPLLGCLVRLRQSPSAHGGASWAPTFGRGPDPKRSEAETDFEVSDDRAGRALLNRHHLRFLLRVPGGVDVLSPTGSSIYGAFLVVVPVVWPYARTQGVSALRLTRRRGLLRQAAGTSVDSWWRRI